MLFNYPNFFRKLPPTTDAGVAETEIPIDLAALDIHRDRARGRKIDNTRDNIWTRLIENAGGGVC